MPLLVEQERADELVVGFGLQLKAKQRTAADPRILKWRTDPVAWVQERLHEFLWSKQRAILESIRDNRRTAVPSAHETGKSFTASRAVCWWLDVHPAGEAFVVTTAPTAPQVRAILWREINRAHRKGQLAGRTNQTEWWLNDEIVAFGRKPADYDPTAFQGIHARYVLVVLDEACHDELTEVMTEGGWRRFSSLDGSERLLTMDQDSHQAEYVTPTRLVKKPYRGPMVEYRSRGADFCVTPDHEMLYRPKLGHVRGDRRYGAWRKGAIGDLLAYTAGCYQVPRTFHWGAPDVAMHTIPALTTDRKSFPALTVPMDDWLTFLGWYCSEGSLRKGRGRLVGIQITQKNPGVLAEIRDLADRLGLAPRLYAQNVVVNSMQVAAHVAECGTGALTKRVPRYVCQASARQIGLFVDAYVRGDGYAKGNGREIIYTSSPQMADDLQELVLKTGVDSVVRPRMLAGRAADFGTHIGTSSVDGFVISRTARPTHLKMVRGNARLIDYDGSVFCATLPKHHLLLTRRHGYAIWSGNCGVPESIYQAANSLAANQHSRILAIGNPDDPSSHFKKICSVGSGWNVVQVDGLQSPNFSGEEIPDELRDLLISDVYVEEMRNDVGEDSPIFASKVRGQFPEDTADGVVPLSAIRKCQTERTWTDEQLLPIEIGFDVGAGGDAAVLRERRGVKTGRTERHHTTDPMELVGHAVNFINSTGAKCIKVDVIGIGWGIAGRLEELHTEGKHGAEVIRVNVGEGSTNPVRFVRLRDQLWWEVGRELIQSQAVDLSDLDDVTIAQLVAPLWKPDSAGRISVEKKDETKKRIHRSPDDADAWLLAYYAAPTMGVWSL